MVPTCFSSRAKVSRRILNRGKYEVQYNICTAANAFGKNQCYYCTFTYRPYRTADFRSLTLTFSINRLESGRILMSTHLLLLLLYNAMKSSLPCLHQPCLPRYCYRSEIWDPLQEATPGLHQLYDRMVDQIQQLTKRTRRYAGSCFPLPLSHNLHFI
jgi:hypothetical protein